MTDRLMEAARRQAKTLVAFSAGPWTRAEAARRAGLSGRRLATMAGANIAHPMWGSDDDAPLWGPCDVLAAVLVDELSHHVSDRALLRELATGIRVRVEAWPSRDGRYVPADAVDRLRDLSGVAAAGLSLLAPLDRTTAEAVAKDSDVEMFGDDGESAGTLHLREVIACGRDCELAPGLVLDDDGNAFGYVLALSATAARLLAAWGHR